jgi:uncharacterized repeat protein (TIGR03843 family)
MDIDVSPTGTDLNDGPDMALSRRVLVSGSSGVVQLLASGDLDIEGRLWDSSNSAVRVLCQMSGRSVRAVYKPLRGERPLWDFPSGTLGRREVATAAVDALLGWGLVPATVWRDDGPLGPGSLQAWVEADSERAPVDVLDSTDVTSSWIVVAEGEGSSGGHVCLAHEDSVDLRRVALLDAIVNNADRKGGHVLRALDGSVWAIDHGLTFHTDPKVRTVLWGWSGQPIAPSDLADLHRLVDDWSAVATALEPQLTRAEMAATRGRLESLLLQGEYPHPDGAWPALPWPAM